MKNGLWFLSTLSTAFLLAMFVCPNLKNYFSCFASFFLLFLPLPSFKLLNALYLKFERLKISGRTFVRQKSGVPDWGIPLNRVLGIFEVGKYEEKFFPNRTLKNSNFEPSKLHIKLWSTNSQLLIWSNLLQNTFAFLRHQLLPKGVSPVLLDCEQI